MISRNLEFIKYCLVSVYPIKYDKITLIVLDNCFNVIILYHNLLLRDATNYNSKISLNIMKNHFKYNIYYYYINLIVT